jgi:hypothetical protein
MHRFGGVASLELSVRPTKKPEERTSLSENDNDNTRLARKSYVRSGLKSRGCDNVIHALVSMLFNSPQPARLDPKPIDSCWSRVVVYRRRRDLGTYPMADRCDGAASIDNPWFDPSENPVTL